MNASHIHEVSGRRWLSHTLSRSRASGFTMVELVIVVMIAMVIMVSAIPIINTTLNNMHLGSAASSLAAAIQSTRYQAISAGCPYQFTLLPASNSYQLATEVISGNPPACASTYTNTGPNNNPAPVPFANADVTISTSTACPNTSFLLNPGGTISAVGTPTIASSFCIVLSHGAATKTVTVTGVGNVKVTSP
jgi:Tfp pilus assembly protein FimT